MQPHRFVVLAALVTFSYTGGCVRAETPGAATTAVSATPEPAWVHEPEPSFPEQPTRDAAAATTLKKFVAALVRADAATAVACSTDDPVGRQVLADLIQCSDAVREAARLQHRAPDDATRQRFDNWVAAAVGDTFRLSASRASQLTSPHFERIGLVRVDGGWRVDVLSFEGGKYRREPLRATLELAKACGELECVRANPAASRDAIADAGVLAEREELRRHPAATALPEPDLSSPEAALREAYIVQNSPTVPIDRIARVLEPTPWVRYVISEREHDAEWTAQVVTACTECGVEGAIAATEYKVRPLLAVEYFEAVWQRNLNESQALRNRASGQTAPGPARESMPVVQQSDGTWKARWDTSGPVPRSGESTRRKILDALLAAIRRGEFKTYEEVLRGQYRIMMSLAADAARGDRP